MIAGAENGTDGSPYTVGIYASWRWLFRRRGFEAVSTNCVTFLRPRCSREHNRIAAYNYTIRATDR